MKVVLSRDHFDYYLFVITVLFRFLNSNDEVFSTEPVKNLGKGTRLSFYHAQNVRNISVFFVLLYFMRYSKSCELLWSVRGTRNSGLDFGAIGIRTRTFPSIHCVSINGTDVAHYNFNAHQPILVIFGGDVTERVCYQMVIFISPTLPN